MVVTRWNIDSSKTADYMKQLCQVAERSRYGERDAISATAARIAARISPPVLLGRVSVGRNKMTSQEMGMKTTISAIIVMLLLCTMPILASNRLDLILEGPWILYTDSTLISGQTVLVAMTPPQPTAYAHKPPYITGGYGAPFPSTGVFCLGFETTCAPGRGVNDLSSDTYPRRAVAHIFSFGLEVVGSPCV